MKLELPSKAGDRKRWGNLFGAASALAVSETMKQHRGVAVVVAESNILAEQLEQQLQFFLTDVECPILHLPDWETLPYDSFSPHQDIISDRLLTLHRLQTLRRGLVIVSLPTLMQRLPPPEYVVANTLLFATGQRIEATTFLEQLSKAGYRRVDTVFEHGDFAVRGALLDIYPMGGDLPYRIELFDDEIESLRTFDPDNQRTIDKVDSIRLLPAREYPLNKQGIATFRDNWHAQFDVDHRRCPIYNDVTSGLASAGLEYYLALFFEKTATLLDYLPKDCLLFTPPELENIAQHHWQEISNRYEQYSVDPQRPLLPPRQAFFPIDELFTALKPLPQIQLHPKELDSRAGNLNLAFSIPPELPIDIRSESPLANLQRFLETTTQRVLFCAESAGRREALLELLQRIRIKPATFSAWGDFIASQEAIGITVAQLDLGVSCKDPAIALVAESQLFGQRISQRRRRGKTTDSSDAVIKNLTELQPGAAVVHIDHGVGRFRGLQTLEIEGQAAEFVTLEYAEGAKLYVPVASLHLISRYSGSDPELAPLSRLGSDQWQKAKRKAAEKIRDVAAELLDIYARRAARAGFEHRCPKEAYDAFSASFPFEETPDQEAAIKAVRNDMMAKTPMDRLVCGDVGFGKTEVAMRAAFIAVQSGKQVAVLVPTTLLAQQHYENFRDRFADWPVNVEVLSRFKSNKEQSAALAKLAEGQIDIMIGTHKLIQEDVNYQNLGLIIIDEEHRFGVRQKEMLKALRTEADILTLTATPIPRTLNMSMSGMRDLSIIATPPAKRLSVKTFVRQQDPALVKEAVLREILRGGQVYYLHNEVKTIEKAATELQALIPEARIGIAHGQMRERELEQVMSDFYHKRHNILLCSTIIETGIDVPSANTIIIERADKFGLAQLHQLRGRVGRSHHQAYAYLLTPPPKQMTEDAHKRLEAIEAASDLGSGFMLATHDLEIRGAGELLGDEQSGQIQTIGFSLYMELLNRTVKAIQEGKNPDFDHPLPDTVEVNLRLPALIPEDYLPDVHTRLTLYKRLASTRNDDELRELQVEMIDRFGLLPEPAKNLVRITSIKQAAELIGIRKIDLGSKGGRVEFSHDTRVEPIKLVRMVQSAPQQYRIEGGSALKISRNLADNESRLQYIETLIHDLMPAGAAQ